MEVASSDARAREGISVASNNQDDMGSFEKLRSAGDGYSVRVKICGVREVHDALAAAEAGADFIGLVFVPGRRRQIKVEEAQRLTSNLRRNLSKPPRVVGLFADQLLEDVHAIVRRCGLDMVQLCGQESLDYCAQVEVPLIKVVHVPNGLGRQDASSTLASEMATLSERRYLITLDRKVEGLQGGTGETFDWEIATALSTNGLTFLLAGGLTPENVALAVHTVQPWGVDVSSGVETSGAKDAAKIRAFIKAARHAGRGA